MARYNFYIVLYCIDSVVYADAHLDRNFYVAVCSNDRCSSKYNYAADG